jgi:hypothetical protein
MILHKKGAYIKLLKDKILLNKCTKSLGNILQIMDVQPLSKLTFKDNYLRKTPNSTVRFPCLTSLKTCSEVKNSEPPNVSKT